MKRVLKMIGIAALCVAILMGIIATANGAPANVYLMAVNDRPMEMTAENMPMMVGGTLYVPYTMLSSRVTTINLGVSAQYNSTRRTVLVSSGQQGVVFDLQANNSYDIRSNPLNAHAVVRNSMVFLPIMWICNYFGNINCTLSRTNYGTLVRVTNSAVVLSDREFVDAANNQLKDNYNRYLSSIQPTATPVPTAAPTVRPTDRPSPSTSASRPSSAPRPSSTPAPTATPRPTEPPPGANAEVALAYRWGDQAEEAARLLEHANQRALFLFTPGEAAANDGLVRRLAAAGHTVGLVLTGETAEDCLAQAEEGAALLASAARYPLFIVEAPALDGDGQAALEQAGYVLWAPRLRGENYSSANGIMRELSGRRLNLVELTCDRAGLDLSRSLWNAMTNANCRVQQATAPLLSPAAD